MEYISHEHFKNLMGKFQKETPKGILREGFNFDDEGEEHSLAIEKDLEDLFDAGKIDQQTLNKALVYVSNNDYDLYSDNLDVNYVLQQVGHMEEGNAFTAALAKTPKGGEFKVGSKEFKDKTNYDDPSVKEYGYADQYPGAWPFREEEMEEGLHMPPLQATGPTIDTVEEDYMDKPFKVPVRKDTSVLDYDPDASRFEPDYMKTPGEDDDDDEDNFDLDDDDFDISSSEELPKHFRKTVATDKSRFPFLKENAVSNPPFGFDVLSPDERKQLKEYIESIKTIKKEIAKLTAKAGKNVKSEDLGGNRTGLVMTPSVTSEADSHDKIEKIEDKIPEKIYQASVLVIRQLRKAGLTDGEIMMFLKHEMEEEGQKAIMGQHDF